MAKSSVANQLAALKKQREALEKKEQALKAKSHGVVLNKIVQMAKDAGLTASDISKALSDGKSAKAPAKKNAGKGKLAGRKVEAKYRNPANQEQTWTGRGVAPAWVQELKKTGTLESALILKAAPVAQA
jgi:DNA-binding protein H-NS